MRGFAASLLVAVALMLFAVAVPSSAMAAEPAVKYRSDYDEYFRKYSKRFFGVNKDWRWFKAQAIAESNLESTARSAVAAKGVMQIMPNTFVELQKKNPEFENIDDPRWNIAAGIYYDSTLWRRYEALSDDQQRRNFMFGAYNAGPATMTRARQLAESAGHDSTQWSSVIAVAPKVPSWRHKETLRYIDRIQGVFAALQGF
ncbi:MAG: transglycosylase SLT domain-containing protein [Pseudomonadota bacterium]